MLFGFCKELATNKKWFGELASLKQVGEKCCRKSLPTLRGLPAICLSTTPARDGFARCSAENTWLCVACAMISRSVLRNNSRHIASLFATRKYLALINGGGGGLN